MSTSILYDAPGPRTKRLELIGSVVGGLVVLGLVGLAIWQLARNGIFDDRWKVFTEPPKNQKASDVWRFLLEGLWATMRAALVAAPMALILGALLAVWRMSEARWLRLPAVVIIELFRGLPVVLMMFFGVVALGLELFQGVVFGLVVYNMAIFSEILRAGIAALPKGQAEAAYAVGLTRRQTMTSILLPQAVRAMLPSLISQLVVLLKDSSLGFIVGYPELLQSIRNLRDFFGADYLFPLFFVGAAIYVAVNFTLSRVAVWAEKRMSRTAAHVVAVPDVEAA